MATPDFDHQSSEVEWSIQPAYSMADNDATMVCAMTGFAKRPHEVVYKGSFIDEFVGFYAIGQDSAEQLARLVGYVDPDDLPDEAALNEQLIEKVNELEATIAEQELNLDAYAQLLGPIEVDEEVEE